jgi:hypothetical protein
MKKNIHDYERIARTIGGLTLASMAFWGPKRPWLLGFAGAAVSGLVGTCPLYSALGISTRSSVEAQANDYLPVQSPSEEAAGHPIVGAV